MILLAGSPEANSLQCNGDNLHNELSPCFQEGYQSPEKTSLFQNAQIKASWRVLPEERRNLQPTPDNDIHAMRLISDKARADEGYDETPFLDLSFVGSAYARDRQMSNDETDEELPQFWHHSMAIHQDMVSSQITTLSSTQISSNFEGSFIDSVSVLSRSAQPPQTSHTVNLSSTCARFCNLGEIPSARLLRTVCAQPLTVNLVVGVISLPGPRVVSVRSTRQPMEIHEMVVGDETRSGFGITFWLAPVEHEGQTSTGELRAGLERVRHQDVVLVRNVALSIFRGHVYGQSLKKNVTKVDVLHSRVNNSNAFYTSKQIESASQVDLQVAKVRRVMRWVTDFVGPSAGSHRSDADGGEVQRKKRMRTSILPPNTP